MEVPEAVEQHTQEGADVLKVLAKELQQHVLRTGLPVRVPKTRSVIFELHCVTAHAISNDLLDRATALDGLIRRILGHRLGYGPDGATALVLFGLAKGTTGMTLTRRRERCAELRHVHLDHWRKHLEPKLLEAVAYELHLLDRHYEPRLPEAVPNRPGLGDPDMTMDGLFRAELEVTHLVPHVRLPR
jgi:hypothetical protein